MFIDTHTRMRIHTALVVVLRFARFLLRCTTCRLSLSFVHTFRGSSHHVYQISVLQQLTTRDQHTGVKLAKLQNTICLAPKAAFVTLVWNIYTLVMVT